MDLFTSENAPERHRPMAATTWPVTPSAPTSNTRSASSRAVPCPTCATARSRCSAASCLRWTAWAWAFPAQRQHRGQAGQERARGGRCAGQATIRTATSAAYDALVRMAQDFSQRYPLIDGQGNFGSRDGDGAAAMRYTEARLAKHHHALLLDEIDQGTVDFIPNYDGSTKSPSNCPRACPSTCSTAPAASPWAWPPRSPVTTCARWPTPAWRW
jgi:hypothetical protein